MSAMISYHCQIVSSVKSGNKSFINSERSHLLPVTILLRIQLEFFLYVEKTFYMQATLFLYMSYYNYHH